MGRRFENAKHLLAPLAANCRDFQDRWRDAGPPAGPDDLTGRWEGEWVSAATGHRGPLRAVVVATGSDRLVASFRASYRSIFRACYSTELHAARNPSGGFTLSGQSDLGWAAGGLYEYDGEADGAEFVCRYRSRVDRGEFRLLRRPE
jgi:hypothetical protein